MVLSSRGPEGLPCEDWISCQLNLNGYFWLRLRGIPSKSEVVMMRREELVWASGELIWCQVGRWKRNDSNISNTTLLSLDTHPVLSFLKPSFKELNTHTHTNTHRIVDFTYDMASRNSSSAPALRRNWGINYLRWPPEGFLYNIGGNMLHLIWTRLSPNWNLVYHQHLTAVSMALSVPQIFLNRYFVEDFPCRLSYKNLKLKRTERKPKQYKMFHSLYLFISAIV